MNKYFLLKSDYATVKKKHGLKSSWTDYKPARQASNIYTCKTLIQLKGACTQINRNNKHEPYIGSTGHANMYLGDKSQTVIQKGII